MMGSGMEERLIGPDALWSSINDTDTAKVAKIAASMESSGWSGRPLLVEEGSYDRLFAWTGSHRIAAAKQVGLRGIPCRVISRAVSDAALERLPDAVGFSSLRDALTMRSNGGGRNDPQRLEGLKRLGLMDAAAALQEEIAADEW